MFFTSSLRTLLSVLHLFPRLICLCLTHNARCDDGQLPFPVSVPLLGAVVVTAQVIQNRVAFNGTETHILCWIWIDFSGPEQSSCSPSQRLNQTVRSAQTRQDLDQE